MREIRKYLNAALCMDNRLEDLKRSAEDLVYQEQLLKEYRIGRYAQEQQGVLNDLVIYAAR